MEKIGKYTILGELGKGAMGIVYKGLDPLIERHVAIKTIRFDLLSEREEQEEAQVRFIREARSAGTLSHPHIVTIYEVGEDQGLTYIAMEYIEGKSLEGLLASGKKFAFADIVTLISRIGEALDYAHKKGVIHRDIKPANILIDKEGHPHIVDFGIARMASATLTLTKSVIGTPYYMSPEQISGKKIDNRADIFSLGTILYELLTGKKPFPGDSLTTIIYKIMNEEPPPVRTLELDIPEGIDAILVKALAKNPDARYANCAELTRDLGRLVEAPEKPEIRQKARRREVVSPKKDKMKRGTPGKRRKTLLVVVGAMMVVVAALLISLLYYFGEGNPLRLLGLGGASPLAETSPSQEQPAAAKQPAQEEAIPEQTPPKPQEEEVSSLQAMEAALNAAAALKTQGRPDESIAAYERASALNETDPRPYLQLGEIYEQKQDWEKAKHNYERYFNIAPPGEETERVKQKITILEERLLAAERMRQKRDKAIIADQAAKKDERPMERPKDAKIPSPAKPEPVKAATEGPDLNQMFSRGTQALREGNYESCIQQMEEVLKYEPDNKEAKYYLAVARKRLDDQEKERQKENARAAEIAQSLKTIEADMQAENYEKSIAGANQVLRLDPQNKQAREYLNLAYLKIAPGEITAVIEAYVQSIIKETLPAFYRATCSADLYLRISSDVELIIKLYDNLQALASNIRTDVKSTPEGRLTADVRFAHIMTGISQTKGIREVLFEGTMVWKMEKRASEWKIIEIQYQTTEKEPPTKEVR